MKKFKLLFFALLVATTGFFSSCEEETSGPSFDFSGGDYISENTTVGAGDEIKFKWTITSDVNMETMDITKNGSYVAGWADKEIDNASKNTYIDEVTLPADNNPGTYTYEFTVYDGDGVEIISKSIVITVVAVKALTTYDNNHTMGGAGSSNGSYLDAETGIIYKLGDLTDNVKTLIDIVFDAGQFKNTASALTSATGTTFATTTLTTAQFDAATSDFLFSGITASANNITISANSVVLFQTKGGKKGIIKVKSLTSTDVTIAIKIQQ
jgi:hypothetical protein